VPTTTGIAQPSFAMVDKITTVRRSNLGTRIGRVSATLMADIERSLMEAVEKHRHHAFAGRLGCEGAAELAIRGIMLASNQVQINWAHVSA
jgi:PemK-like, MazF-like toxin of type II toxin-antitoxin system